MSKTMNFRVGSNGPVIKDHEGNSLYHSAKRNVRARILAKADAFLQNEARMQELEALGMSRESYERFMGVRKDSPRTSSRY